MKALIFLVRKRLKNTIVSMLKNPGQLIFILFIVGMMVFSMFTANTEHPDAAGYRDINELYAIVFLFYALIFFFSVRPGFKNGATFFSLADVNIAFNAPIQPKTILLYGMMRQLGMSLFAGFFLLFQYSWMRMSYGITGWSLAGILLGYALTMFCGQQIAMLIYSRTARDEQKQHRVQNMALVLALALAAWLLYPVLTTSFSDGFDNFDFNKLLGALVASVNRPVVNYIPVLGWLKTLAQGMHEQNWLLAGAGLGATGLLIALLIWIIGLVDADFYEDVLAATEISHSSIAAKKEGRNAEVVPQNVKVGAEGLNRGKGASAFFYKHLLEGRRSRKFIMDTASLMFMLITLVFAFFMRDLGLSIGPLAFSIYMLIFSSFMGRWAKELLLPYVYLVPEPPFKKLIMILGETFRKNLVESVIVGTGIGLIMQVGVFETLGIIALRFAASVLFIAATILSERLFGGLTIRWMQMTFLILTMMIVMIPTVVVAVLVMVTANSWPLTYFAAAAFTLALSALILFLCRNMLAAVELNNR